MRRRSSLIGLAAALLWSLAALDTVRAAHAAVGTPVVNAEMPTLAGERARPLADTGVSVLVFFRPHQERSASGLRELAKCKDSLAAKPVRWVGVVSDAVAADAAAAVAREAKFDAPILVDRGDALYGSLGVALHPVAVVVGRDRKLAAFEPFRSLDYCTVLAARVRHALGEIGDDELRAALEPPKATEGGDAQVARRYRALAEMQMKAGRLDQALDSVNKSLEKDPKLAASHALLGEIQAARSNCASALPAFRQSLALDPGNETARVGIERCKKAQ